MHVLLIDDDKELADVLKSVLNMYSIEMDISYSPIEGLEKLNQTHYDLLLLDVMLPNINGLEFCRKIRQLPTQLADIPIIILSARTELVDKVVGLETGADDYLGKPFEPRELVARIHALLRRYNHKPSVYNQSTSTAEAEQLFVLGQDKLVINKTSVSVSLNGVSLELSPLEFDVLNVLANRAKEVINKEELLALTTGASSLYADNLIALIYRMRSKLKQTGAQNEFIRTVRSKGYAFMGEEVAP